MFKKGFVSQTAVRQGQSDLQTAANAVLQAERTLRLGRLADVEIQAVKDEAARARDPKDKPAGEKDKRWARVEIRAPLDGTILEKNVAVGDVVEANKALFHIGDLSKLQVVVHASEEVVVALRALKAEQRRWTIQVQADPDAAPIEGHIEWMGAALDPRTHTAPLMGLVANPAGRLMPGQFVTATIQLPPVAGEVAIPAAALVEADGQAFVFVQPDPSKAVYVQRRVLVVRRGRDVVHLRSVLRPDEQGRGLEVLRPGDRLVTTGVVELQALLHDLKGRAK
jgi:cobalt-zinc-cadmium efflux system membrane fusion protein